MVAAEREGEPVLVINSVEFNNEGAKHIDMLMPRIAEMVQDVSRRAGFKRIFVGISDFGRRWFDERFPQADPAVTIVKVHHEELGYAYYFDAFSLKRGAQGRRYEYMKRRTFVVRAYAVIFGVLKYLKGNVAKAAAFFDSARNVNNCWEVPIGSR